MDFNLKMVPTPAEEVKVTPVFRTPRKWKTRGFRLKQTLTRLGLVAVLSIGSYFLFSSYLVKSVQVTGASMVPTLHDGDQYMLNRWAYFFGTPQRGDVVVIKDPEDNGFAVKRIVATSGDAVLFKDGEVYVNNKKLVEPYLFAGTTTSTFSQPNEQLILFGSNRYFVLGDNRWNSADSRFYGAVPRKNILGLLSSQ